MSLVFEKISQVLAAGETMKTGIAGSFMRLAACQWPVTMSIIKDRRIVGTMKNMLAGDYIEAVEFDEIWIINGSTAQQIELQISGGGAGSNRVLGEVSVINGELNRVKANACFIATCLSPAVAGQLSAVQIYNPAASGVNLIVNKLSVFSQVLSGYYLTNHSPALATLSGAGVSKKLGGAVGKGELRYAANAAMLGALMGYFSIPNAWDSRDYPFSEPIIVAPGGGLVLQMTTPNLPNYTTVQWNEEGV